MLMSVGVAAESEALAVHVSVTDGIAWAAANTEKRNTNTVKSFLMLPPIIRFAIAYCSTVIAV